MWVAVSLVALPRPINLGGRLYVANFGTVAAVRLDEHVLKAEVVTKTFTAVKFAPCIMK